MQKKEGLCYSFPMKAKKVLFHIFILLMLTQLALPALSNSFRAVITSDPALREYAFSKEEGVPNPFLDGVTISLITIAPGDEVYAWYGHTAIEVASPELGGDRWFDYGVFSYGPTFIQDFIRGHLDYLVVQRFAHYGIEESQDENRRVQRIPLTLTADAKQDLIEFLGENVKSENNTYLYRFYDQNCATKVRDIIDATTGGDFKAWATAIPYHDTLRTITTDHMGRSWMMNFALNFLESGAIDHPITLWEASFMPSILSDAFAKYQGVEPTTISTGRENKPQRAHLTLSSLAIGIILALLLYTTRERMRRVYGLLACLVFLILTVLSGMLIFINLASWYDVSFNNENLIFVNPLLLIATIDALFCIFKPKHEDKALSLVCRILTTLALLLLVAKGLFPGVLCQDNICVFALVLPLYILLGWGRRRKHVSLQTGL